MSLLSKLANRLILCPSTEPIDAGDRERVLVETPNGRVESWVMQSEDCGIGSQAIDLVVLKFAGTAGRAERSGLHPAETWPTLKSEVWTVNPLGYGGSDGQATIGSFPETATAVFKFLNDRYPQQPKLVVGNSLGCLSALFLAARFNVDGLFLRNPPPISQMIRSRPKYSWWNLGLSRWIADEVPEELDAPINAARSTAPCLFVQSESDRLVPCRYQDLIIQQYAGPHRVFQIKDADHHDRVSESQQQDYFNDLFWLRDQLEATS